MSKAALVCRLKSATSRLTGARGLSSKLGLAALKARPRLPASFVWVIEPSYMAGEAVCAQLNFRTLRDPFEQ